MKIAVVAPGPVPSIQGGAERLWKGLCDHINQETSSRADLITLPSPETTFTELMVSYRQFSELDLSRFDRVVSGKYPAWMVDHPDHYLYMVHKLRGVYDTYDLHSEALSEWLRSAPREVQALEKVITRVSPGREILSEFWGILDEAANQEFEGWFAFPGPLTRQVIHFLDDIGINEKSITKFCAISNTVAQRDNYFPDTVDPLVLHPPTDLLVIPPIDNEYLFTVSRLDVPKRIDLLITAFMATEVDSEFRIAGAGPQLGRLKKLASRDSRIIFLGEISDQELIQQYAGSAYVPFIPYDEDYGLVGIEAMLSAKALLTVVDAGGINEVFVPGQMGLSVEPDQKELAQAMTWMSENAAAVQRMGCAARARATLITWQNIISIMVEQVTVTKHLPATRKKCVVVLTFPVWPPQNGGQSRVYNLYKEVARSHDVTLVSFVDYNQSAKELELSPGLIEIQVPKTLQHHRAEQSISDLLGAPGGDIAAISGSFLTPLYGATLAHLCSSADLVIASHPYCYSAIRKVYKGRLWYEAHNVEFDIKKTILPDTEAGRLWIEAVRTVEEACYQDSESTFTCSAEDAARLEQLYGARPTFVVPNGVKVLPWANVCRARSSGLRERIGCGSRLTALFMGSWHGPNIDAVQWLSDNLTGNESFQILLIGSVCDHSSFETLPSNIIKLGLLPEYEKTAIMRAVDLALNPTMSGSGTNLKVLEYVSAGVPVLSTSFGNRGFPFIHGESILIAELEQFKIKLVEMSRKTDTPFLNKIAKNAYSHIANFEWQKIAHSLTIKIS